MEQTQQPLGPAAAYKHDHGPIKNPLEVHENKQTTGQRIADKVASAVGSWPFIIIQSCMLVAWMGLNVYLVMNPAALKSWDPYPFILLNLVLSFQAAYTGPVVMMSQNRQSEKDRIMAENDYQTNLRAEEEIRVVMDHLAHQDTLLLDAIKRLESLQLPPSAQPAATSIDEILKRMEQNDSRILALMEKMSGQPPA